jgi:polyphosphate:AMP phosphotransferase
MFETAELGQAISKRDYKDREGVLREELLDAQFRLQEANFPVILLLNGVDGAGKGDVANLLNEWMDARLIRTLAYDVPTTEEGERPSMWRFWRDLPGAGQMGVFLKAWYSDPFIQRVNGEISHEEFSTSLSRIMAFEQTLAVDGAVILKFWLHLGRKQQKKRFKSLEKDPQTAWQVTKKDWANWKRYDEFVPVAEHLIMRTSTGRAPWEIVECSDPGFRNLEIGAALLRGIHRGLAEQDRRAVVATEGKFNGSGKRKVDEEIPDELDLGTTGDGDYPGETILSSLDMEKSLSKADYKEELTEALGRLNTLWRKARARELSMILLFEGWDAAGKGGVIRRIIQPLDARHYQVLSVAAPTDEERAHHYLWRFWRHLPRAGRVSIFDRTWYGRVLVERIEGFATPREWMRAYAEINHFEGALLEHDLVLMKFWIHITPEEQEARFLARADSPLKSWKLTEEDWRNRDRWGAYERAVNDMVERTSTRLAPWTLIEGNDKKYARVRVLKEVCGALEKALKRKK